MRKKYCTIIGVDLKIESYREPQPLAVTVKLIANLQQLLQISCPPHPRQLLATIFQDVACQCEIGCKEVRALWLPIVCKMLTPNTRQAIVKI